MGKYDIIDKEFVREPEHAAEIISNVVYKGRLHVLPQDLEGLHEKCKSNRNREAELERDALFLCPKHAVKYGIEVENYADYGMPRRIRRIIIQNCASSLKPCRRGMIRKSSAVCLKERNFRIYRH